MLRIVTFATSLLAFLFCYSSVVLGADSGNYDYGGAKKPSREERIESWLQGEVGKQYWARNSPPLKIFCDSPMVPPRDRLPNCLRNGKNFSVKETEKFTIKSVTSRGDFENSWFSILFDSGMSAYVQASSFRGLRYDEREIDTRLHGYYGLLSIAEHNIFFEEHPDIVFDRLRVGIEDEKKRRALKKQDEERQEKARMARGKARIGMTKAQVISSSWGKPESINTTIVGKITQEQWVYGLGDYLYFSNGRLTAIQTSD